MKSYERDASAKVLRMECDSDELPLSFDDLRGCSTDAEADRLWAAGVPAVSRGWSLVVRVVDRAGTNLCTFGRAEVIRLDARHRAKAKEGAGA